MRAGDSGGPVYNYASVNGMPACAAIGILHGMDAAKNSYYIHTEYAYAVYGLNMSLW